MEFENVTLATESITLFTATGLHTFKNLIDLNTLDLKGYEKEYVKLTWKSYLNVVCDLDDNAVESFIADNGYVFPQDWFDEYCTLLK